MTVEQTGAVLDLLEGAFPQAFPSDRARRKVLRLWSEAFAADDAGDVKAAVLAYVNTAEKSFLPAPGQIRARMPRGRTRPSPTAVGASWQKQRGRLERYAQVLERRRAAGVPATWTEARAAGLTAKAWASLTAQPGLDVEEAL